MIKRGRKTSKDVQKIRASLEIMKGSNLVKTCQMPVELGRRAGNWDHLDACQALK